MNDDRISIRRTVLYVAQDNTFCSCAGDFWKTCSLRVIHELPCRDAIVSINPIKEDRSDPAAPSVKSLDATLANLTDSMRNIEDRFKI